MGSGVGLLGNGSGIETREGNREEEVFGFLVL